MTRKTSSGRPASGAKGRTAGKPASKRKPDATDIVVRGAREHNLRNISLRLPRNKLIVMTGVSGSGKSSLAFDTLYAEGQRRYVESLSTYARQFLGQLPRPNVDSITGLAPSISIQQKSTSRNPRSTVGTITEIHDYLRVLFARVGTGYCYVSGKPIQAQSGEQIIESIDRLPEGTRYAILAPVVQNQKGEFKDLFTDLMKRGYLRARVDGEIVSLADDLKLKRHHKHTIDVVVDRLIAGKGGRSRLAEAVEIALKVGERRLICSVDSQDETSKSARKRNDRLFSADYSCPESGMSYEAPTPQLFSFNSPIGMCTDCMGLGMRHGFREDAIVESPKKSISRGALLLLPSFGSVGRWRKHIYQGAAAAIEKDCGMKSGTLLKAKWQDLPEEARSRFLYGLGDRQLVFGYRTRGGVYKHTGKWKGWANELLDNYHTTRNPMRRRQLDKYLEFVGCPTCQGERLNRQARNVRLTSSNRAFRQRHGISEMTLPQVCALSIAEASEFFSELVLDQTQQLIAEDALREIRGRLGFLLQCGLHYLSLERSAPTLSGGESQRIRLAGQIGCGLVGVVYILDEPSIGLHPRDNAMLLDSICHLRDQGNTVIVVEHDEDTMRAADHIVDFGPGPGNRGGELVVEGSLQDVLKSKRSVTGRYLSGKATIEVPTQRRQASDRKLIVRNARHNNLKGVDAEFPLGLFVCVTGVSGSGKSSLVNDILWNVVHRELNKGKAEPGLHDSISGLDFLDKAIDIDQSPIGRTPRSNPATYVKVLDEIRKLYTNLPQSKLRGYKPGRFSFNVAGGRCEACEGHGANKLEMDFLADIWVTCPVCEGRRFNRETLEVRFQDHSIADVLDLEIRDALALFQNIPKVAKLLQTLCDVGLDYMHLGQPSPTLSGGEAQRIKLSRELGKRSTGQTLYLLDEPTTGLHFADVHKLLEVLHNLVDAGNTVIVVEHNLDVIKTADWVIDMGPEGGAGGGELVISGTPEDIAAHPDSYTGEALRPLLPDVTVRRKRKRKGGNGRPAVVGVSGSGDPLTTGSGAPVVVGAPVEDPFESRESIRITRASQHNLQGLSLSVPRDKLNVFCGPSGSGKTSLAMDTLYAEGQRRYVESLSAYARQFLGQMPKPKVERIQGLSPAIAIEQKTVGATPRSTVGTVTEIYDYLRVLFARLGSVYCPECGVPAEQQTTDQIVESILSLPHRSKLMLTAPIHVVHTQSYESKWDQLRGSGFVRVRVDGRTYRLEEAPGINHRRAHDVSIVIDRITVDSRSRGRIADSIEAALDAGHGILETVEVVEDAEEADWPMRRYSLLLSCPSCRRSFEQPVPQWFSFNSPLGWCVACEGLGTEFGADQSLLISSPERSLRGGAVSMWPDPAVSPVFAAILEALSERFGIPLDEPWYKLSPRNQRIVLYGSGEEWIDIAASKAACSPMKIRYRGLYPTMEMASRLSYDVRQQVRDMAGTKDCSICDGTRLRADAAAVRLGPNPKDAVTLPQLCRMPLSQSLAFLQSIKLNAADRKVAGDLLTEAIHRLTFLIDVGLDYISLHRGMPTLSGGESQRIRLAGQVGRSLTGVLYVLDEPTIGLHPRDNARLIQALKRLRDLGNTILLVEHDREVLQAADRLFDFGPGAGRLGGNITAEGTPQELANDHPESLTGGYLSNRLGIPIPENRRISSIAEGPVPPRDGWLTLTGATQHNLQSVDLRLPLGTLTCITGVSGSGKSSLVMQTLARAVAKALGQATETPGPYRRLEGIEHISRLIPVDQKPIGNTPASNPATYTGVFDHIRELFARLPQARVRGYRPGRFSFNRSGGRCEDCEGMGRRRIEMHFLPDVWVECTTCGGKRYNTETLAVTFNDHSIADVLELPIADALKLFERVPKIRAPLATLDAIGLGYLTLGQSANALSGGEAQRIKLAAELTRSGQGRTLFVLDEPTTGLHVDDILKLLKVLNSLIEQGNTVVVIEHNLDVIKTADWIIDIGPEAGAGGGRIVAEGTPEDVVAKAAGGNGVTAAAGRRRRKRSTGVAEARPDYSVGRSWTAELLADALRHSAVEAVECFDVASVTKKHAGDLSINDVSRDAKSPWDDDGIRWHTRDRLSHAGKPCRWDGRALELLAEQLAAIEGLSEPNWNHRSTVEWLSAEKKGGWFLHARTADEWMMTLTFRVKKGTFDQDDLLSRLSLTRLDDMDEVLANNRGPRARVRRLKSAWEEVNVRIVKREDVDTAAFREFLSDAAKGFLTQAHAESAKPADLMPWKQLGRKWHIMRKGFSRGRVAWNAEVLTELLTVLDHALAGFRIDETNKIKINWYAPQTDKLAVELYTKSRDAIKLHLFVPHDSITQGRLSALPADETTVEKHRSGADVVKLQVSKRGQVSSSEMTALLREVVGEIGK